MVAPIDAKSVIEVDGEPITLRLCYRSIALGEQLGVDLFAEEGIDLTLSKAALLVKCLAITEHPTITEDEALAVVMRYGISNIGPVILDLIARFGGKSDDADAEGKAPAKAKATARKPRARA